MFIDLVKITVKAGNGGSGCLSFRREKFVPKGGPDGGNGGKGGDVLLRVDPGLTTLLDLQYHQSYKAKRGGHGQGSNKTGANGQDCIIPVPSGTLVRDLATGGLLGDLTLPGSQLVVARGGRGGRGNTAFKSPTNRAPRQFEPGQEAEVRQLELELKVIADVGLVGLPNAGKSTLLSVLSAARPKIADYPFTTLEPCLGIVRYRDYKSFVMADIPGLIEGSHEGKGLGIKFLKHIQRTKLLVYLIDCTSPGVEKDYAALRRETGLFDPGLIQKPALMVLSKIDLLGGRKIQNGMFDCRISSVSGEGLGDLKSLIWKRLQEQTKELSPEVLG